MSEGEQKQSSSKKKHKLWSQTKNQNTEYSSIPSMSVMSDENEIDWCTVCNVLEENKFFEDEKESNQTYKYLQKQQKIKLQQSFTNYTQFTENESCDMDTFRTHVCKAYYSKHDKKYMFYKVLYENGFTNLKKRHQFYHILLHSYLKLTDLSINQLSHVLIAIIKQFDRNIDKNDIKAILEYKEITGKKLHELIETGNCDTLQQKFVELKIEFEPIYNHIKQNWNLKDSDDYKLDECNLDLSALNKLINGTYLELKDEDDNIIHYKIQSVTDVQPDIERAKRKKMEKEHIYRMFPDSTNSWLFVNDDDSESKAGKVTDKFIAILVIFLQVLAYITMASFLINEYYDEIEDRKSNCYGPHCHDEEPTCMVLTSGGITSFMLVGFLWGDVLHSVSTIIFSSKRKWIFGSTLVLVELFTAIICGYLVALYSESDFEAINGAVGILFVHDLDEKVFVSMQSINRQKKFVVQKKLLATLCWLLISFTVALGTGCKYTNDRYFPGAERACKKGEFKCGDGECIWSGFVCNGIEDCPDALDEYECDFSLIQCPDDTFKCESDGACIDIKFRCNGDLDCKDGSDESREQNCSQIIAQKQCSNQMAKIKYKYANNTKMIRYEGFYKCNNGQCIDAKYLCDGIVGDCVDHSDEYPVFYSTDRWPFLKECAYFRLIECTSDEVLCKKSGKCISKSRLCDYVEDCPDGEDERLCSYSCPHKIAVGDSFQCGGSIAKIDIEENALILFEDQKRIDYSVGDDISQFIGNDTGKCIRSDFRCDGIKDCEDGSDEMLCELYPCAGDQYQCAKTGKCIPKYWVCDFYCDCDHCDEENYTMCWKYDEIPAWDWQDNNEIKCGESKYELLSKYEVSVWHYFYYVCDTTIKITTCTNKTKTDTVMQFVSDDGLYTTLAYNDDGYEDGFPCEYNNYASTIQLEPQLKCNQSYWIVIEGFYAKESSGEFGIEVICSSKLY